MERVVDDFGCEFGKFRIKRHTLTLRARAFDVRVMSDCAITLSKRAASVSIAHALDRCTDDVLGAFIVKDSKDHGILCVDAVPLFHGDTTTTAYLDIALEQCFTHARSIGGDVGGVYEARAMRGADGTPSATARGLCSAIEDARRRDGDGAHSKTFVIAYDGSTLERLARSEDDGASCAFGTWTLDGTELDARGRVATVETGERKDVRELVRRVIDPSSSDKLEVFDFDDHLDDLSKDWRNATFAT